MPAPGGRTARMRGRRALLAALIAAGCAACAEPRAPIAVKDSMLIVENQTTREWRNVRITINDHFMGGAPSLMPGGLLTAALRDFQTGYGQRFDRGRMSVVKVSVSAVDSRGEPVALQWGGAQKPTLADRIRGQ